MGGVALFELILQNIIRILGSTLPFSKNTFSCPHCRAKLGILKITKESLCSEVDVNAKVFVASYYKQIQFPTKLSRIPRILPKSHMAPEIYFSYMSFYDFVWSEAGNESLVCLWEQLWPEDSVPCGLCLFLVMFVSSSRLFFSLIFHCEFTL